MATTGSGNRSYTPTASDPDRLCRFALPGSGTACQFTYDGAGNVVSDTSSGQGRTLTYDASQRITTIVRGGNVVKLAYGPAGRMKTTVSGTNARTIWNFGGLIERRTRTDGVVQIERQVPGPLGTFVSLRTTLTAAGAPGATETIYRHGDGRANRFFTQADGTVIQATTYAAFGNLTSDSGAAGLTYTDDLWNGGDNLPEVGLVLRGPRAYDPAIGRFLQRDPIAILARSTTANPYAFAFNDPVNHADPTGLSGECADGSCAAAIMTFNAGPAGAGMLYSLMAGGGGGGGSGSGSGLPAGTSYGASQLRVAGNVNLGMGSAMGAGRVNSGACLAGDLCRAGDAATYVGTHGDDILQGAQDFQAGLNSVPQDTAMAIVHTTVDCVTNGAVQCYTNHVAGQIRAAQAFVLDPRGTLEQVITGGSGNPAYIVGRITAFVVEFAIGEAFAAETASVQVEIAAVRGAGGCWDRFGEGHPWPLGFRQPRKRCGERVRTA